VIWRGGGEGIEVALAANPLQQRAVPVDQSIYVAKTLLKRGVCYIVAQCPVGPYVRASPVGVSGARAGTARSEQASPGSDEMDENNDQIAYHRIKIPNTLDTDGSN